MVVLYVTLHREFTMRRPTAVLSLISLLKMASAGAIVLAMGLSCSDTSSPTVGSDGVIRVRVPSVIFDVPDSVKERLSAEAAAGDRIVPIGPVANVLVSPASAAATIAAGSCGSGGGFVGYTKSKVAFAPEKLPRVSPFPLGDEGYIPADTVRLGFNFNFEGNTYDRVNVYFNGFLLFGQAGSQKVGYSSAGNIASTSLPNNVIALAWTDWDLSKSPDAIRYETIGAAPNRKFVLQFNNAPEYAGTGMLTSQVVLSEGSNDITIYTTSMTVRNSSHFVTQGIENALGTQATYDSVLNVNTGIVSRRVKNFFSLQNDAVRFSPISTKDEVPPTITAPNDTTANNDPGLASAVVAVSAPAVSDNCSAVTVTGVRSDGVPSLDAPYPVGVTTITWTAKDADQNAATATQTVTVIDNEAPVWAQSAQSVIQVDATSPSGAVVTFNDLIVTDNVGVTSRSCEPASGSVFHVGTNPVTCTASDAAGNSASMSFSVYVIGAHEQIGSLMEEIADLGLPDGTLQPLLNQLRLAYTQTADGDAACKKVADFLSMVQKKSSNLSSDDVEALTAEATRIMNVMGCPAPVRASISTARFLRVQVQ